MNNLLPVPVLLTIFGAGVALALPRRPRLQRAVSVLCLSGVIVVAAILMWHTDQEGPLALWMGDWPAPLGIVMKAMPCPRA